MEMRSIGIGISHPLDDREPPLVEGRLELLHRRVERHLVVELADVVLRRCDARPRFPIFVEGERDHGVEPVVAAG
jgi:hypothetical protein